ncbi:MAG: hypothetical protein EBT09_10850, partial [Actinobacteria bacterium]|nr:hypothetical protein [Actinomycetota bacterium]
MSDGRYNVSSQSGMYGNKVCTSTRTDNALTQPTEVIRLRFKVLAGQSGLYDMPYTMVWPSTSTSITLSSRVNSQFSANVYADGLYKPMPSFGDFDHAPKVQPQQTASLQIEARLQGRRASDLQTRFIQRMQVELRTPGGGAAPRHLTVADYDTRPNAYSMNWGGSTAPAPSTYPATYPTMRFETITARPTASQGTSVAIATSTMQFNSTGAHPAPENTTVQALDGIEPGTYDVYIKGQSSVGVLVQGVSFGSGASRELRGLVLREGDIDTTEGQVDRINIRDFAAFSTAYNASDPAFALWQPDTYSSVNWNPRADLNQSGYVDVLDFSLLASNYGANGATTIDGNRQAILVASGTFATLSMNSEPATVDLILQPANPGDRIKRAKVAVRGGGSASNGLSNIDVRCPSSEEASTCQVSDALPGRTMTTIAYSNPSPSAGPALIGKVVIDVQWLMGNTNTHDLVFELLDATGFDDSSPARQVFFTAPSLVRPVHVVRDYSYKLVVTSVEGSRNTADVEILVASGPRLGPITGQASILLTGSAGDFTYTCLSDGVGGNPDPDENV